MKSRPSLLGYAVAWSLLIAVLMTVLSFLHNTPGEIAAVGGGLSLSDIGMFFLVWFLGSLIVFLVGGGLYFLMRRIGSGRG